MTATTPSVLIVVPTLGSRTDYLRQTLDSLASQAYPALTVVVVGPAAADDARALSAERGFRYVDEVGRSLSAAINQGWADAEADVLAWLGDDDLMEPGAVARACAALAAAPRASMVYGRCRYVDESGAQLFLARPGRLGSWFSRFGQDMIPQPGSFQRAAAVRAVGGVDESLRLAMDLDLFLRLRRWGPIHYLPRVQASFRLHPGSLTVSNVDAGVEAEQVRLRHLGGLGRRLRPLSRPAFHGAARVWQALQWRHLV